MTEATKTPEEIAAEQAAAKKAAEAAAKQAAKEAKAVEAQAKKDEALKAKAAKEAEAAAKKAAKEAEAKAKADAKAAKDAERAAKEAEKAAKKAEAQPKQNGIVLPKAGTVGHTLFEIFNNKSAELKQPADIGSVFETAQKAGVCDASIRAGYAKWKKFHGLSGRIAAPAAEVAPAPESA